MTNDKNGGGNTVDNLNNWHLKTVEAIIKELNSSERGLSGDEAKKRLEKFGPNKLPEQKVAGWPTIFLSQFKSPLIYLLIAASATIFIMGDVIDSAIIFFVLIFNAVIGTIQEGRAQNTLLALRKFTETTATVLRGEEEIVVPDTDIVPGDIIILREGEKVSADARIFISYGLSVDEAALTGESVSVHKITNPIKGENLPISEQKNILFKGTNVVAGNGRAIVVATGVDTAVGKIAGKITSIDTEIPLNTNIRNLSRIIIYFVVCLSVLLFGVGIFFGNTAREMFSTVVSLAVSVIPEGLPVVITLVLSTGVWRMSKRKVLIKKMQAVEALGQAKIIAVDKTGTLTKNEMVVRKVFVPSSSGDDVLGGNIFNIEGEGYEPRGDIMLNGNVINPANHPELLFVGKISSFCANAYAIFSKEKEQWRAIGDPTEVAINVFAQKTGFQKEELERESPMLADLPFDYNLKYHATVHKVNDSNFLSVVGAPDVLLDMVKKIRRGERSYDMTEKERGGLEKVFLQLAQEGFRVLALTKAKSVPENFDIKNIESLTFVGFVAMKDALRPEVADAARKVTSAGMKVVMITGDHRVTAQAIASEAGIYNEGDVVITGSEINEMSDKELVLRLEKTSVFARVTPEHKMRIIMAYRSRGEIVAMTGDGVNDAPSLVAADLGMAMGKIGTEVAKEAADIVLLDDDFGNIVSAVEEGRNIYKTVKKVILYLFSTNMGEVLTIVAALFLGFPLPLLPAQIIWLNFVTDSFLDASLAMEPKEENLLEKKFKRPGKYILDTLSIGRMIIMSGTMFVCAMFAFHRYLSIDYVKALTVSMTVLAIMQWFNAWNCRSEDKSIFQMNPLSNKFLIAATALVACLQILAVYNPFMQKILHTTALSLGEWLMIIAFSLPIILTEEIRKYFYRIKLSI